MRRAATAVAIPELAFERAASAILPDQVLHPITTATAIKFSMTSEDIVILSMQQELCWSLQMNLMPDEEEESDVRLPNQSFELCHGTKMTHVLGCAPHPDVRGESVWCSPHRLWRCYIAWGPSLTGQTSRRAKRMMSCSPQRKMITMVTDSTAPAATGVAAHWHVEQSSALLHLANVPIRGCPLPRPKKPSLTGEPSESLCSLQPE